VSDSLPDAALDPNLDLLEPEVVEVSDFNLGAGWGSASDASRRAK
jgi:hypothetical protein